MSKKKKEDKKLKKIYTPRPGYDDEDEDLSDEPTGSWHRHFEGDELFGQYEPIRELGTVLHWKCLYISLNSA